jgi:hypothetical protein
MYMAVKMSVSSICPIERDASAILTRRAVEKLLKKVSFDTSSDHLILTGDMINKGPKSGGVVDLARELGASCVRGNHEDRILLERSDMKLHTNEASDQEYTVVSDTAERKVAKSLTDEQAAWLQECPVILKVGVITDMGEVAVVHGGLVPGVPLERQELSSVMSMRTIDLDTHVPSASKDGIPWFKVSLLHSSQCVRFILTIRSSTINIINS